MQHSKWVSATSILFVAQPTISHPPPLPPYSVWKCSPKEMLEDIGKLCLHSQCMDVCMKVRIVLGLVTFPTVYFRCTLPYMIHPIIVGYPNEVNIYDQPCENLQTYPWVKEVQVRLSMPIQSIHIWDKVVVSRRLFNSRGAHFGITCKLRPTWRWNNTIHVSENIIVCLSLYHILTNRQFSPSPI
jgi:hypothetical protein